MPRDESTRLAALRAVQLLDTAPEEAFDRFVRLASRLLRVPTALISLVDDRRQFFKSAVGLGEPWASRRETPLSYSLCKHVVADGAPLVVRDAREDPRVCENLAVRELGIVAYLGVPLTTSDGHVLGALCAIDGVPRAWTDDDVHTLRELATAVLGEVELRASRDALVEPLRRSFAEIDALFANLPLGLVLFDRDLRFVRMNEKLAQINGLPVEALLGRHLGEVFPGFSETLEPVFRAVLETGVPVLDHEVEGETPAQPGERRYWRASYFPVRMDDGAIIGLGGVVAEITHWRKLENEKRQSARLLEDVMDNAPAIISVIDRDGRYRMANRAVARNHGCAPEELLGRPLSDFMPAPAAATVLALDEEARATGAVVERDQMLLLRGRQRHFHIVKFPLGGDHGLPGSVASIVTDTTESHVARERLATLALAGGALAGQLDPHEAFARTAGFLVPAMGDGCVLFVPGADGPELFGVHFTDTTTEPRVRAVAGRLHARAAPYFRAGGASHGRRSKLLSEADLGAVETALPDASDCVSAVFSAVLVDGEVFGVLGLFAVRGSGRRYDEDDRGFIEQVASRLGVSVENRQFLEQRESALASLLQANEELEERVTERTAELVKKHREVEAARGDADRANHSKGEFLARMSHEIRTPLNGVLGIARVLLETPLNEEQRELIQTIHTSGDALLGILNEILDFSKIEAGRVELETLPFDPRVCLKEIVDLFTPTAAQKSLTLAARVEEGVPRGVLGDAARLRQVLGNLVSNAVKFTARGGVTVRAWRGGTAGDGRALLCFEVRDTGVGFDAAQGARLFTPFTQASEATARLHGGTGLGLAITRQLTELMGGTVDATAAPGEGATFTVRVPFGVDASAAAPVKQSPSDVGEVDRAMGTRSPMRVLVVEDNVVNQRVAARMLEMLGYRADLAADGEQAVEATERTRYDVVFMDVHMPVVDGLEATRRIRARASDLPRETIIAMTASSFADDRARCVEAGMDDFVTKPVRVRELAAALQRAIDWRALSAPKAQ